VTNPWALYQRHPAFVLGFHGTEKSTVETVVSSKTTHLKKSEGKFEWLGHGVYFWENDPQRGLEWAQSGNAKKKIEQPAVVGAIIDLGHCLDLTTRIGLDEVKEAYSTVRDAYAAADLVLPANTGGKDHFKRELDCQVIQALHLYRKDKGLPSYDTIRAPFLEDEELYEGAGFRQRNHIQIAVIDTNCIKGYFHPILK
jgi:hypothetical protein